LLKQDKSIDTNVRLDHIGIAVRTFETALRVYRSIGVKIGDRELVADQGVTVQMLSVGATRIELLEPTGDDSPVARFLKKRGEGLHHIALQVGSLSRTLDNLKERGIALIDEEPRRGAAGNLVAFINPASSNGVLIELVERAEPTSANQHSPQIQSEYKRSTRQQGDIDD